MWSNWRWAGICPYNPCQHPRNQHNPWLDSLTQVAPHKMQSRNFLSLGLTLLFSQGCPWPSPAISRSWEDLTARIQQDQPANPKAGQWVVTGVLERKIHLLSSVRACLGHGGWNVYTCVQFSHSKHFFSKILKKNSWSTCQVHASLFTVIDVSET